MIKVIYFNQWVSSITDVITDLKEKYPNDLKIIASSKNKDHVYKYAVDKFIVEDWEEVEEDIEQTKENYINWLLNTCTEYKVDIFFVKKHADWIAEKSIEFSLRNIRLISECKEVLNKFNKKSTIYEQLSNTDINWLIPEYIKISDTDDIAKALDKVIKKAKVTPWCLKLDNDEGGASFRKIDTQPFTLESLKSFRINTITINELSNFAKDNNIKETNKLIFMELLDSPEISIDCYNSKKGFIAICREKEVSTRRQKIYYNKQLSDICESIYKEFKLQFPFNVQFRLKHGTNDNTKLENLRLLEINPRMSGGIYYATALGMNIAEICLCDMLNMEERYNIDRFIGFKTQYITHVEKAVTL